VADIEATRDQLQALDIAAERGCRYAVRKRKSIGGAVNWADLGPVSVEHYADNHDYRGYRVNIEEAAPDAYELQRFVAAYLAKRGFPGVEVRTEW
jgi:hypothetical protein